MFRGGKSTNGEKRKTARRTTELLWPLAGTDTASPRKPQSHSLYVHVHVTPINSHYMLFASAYIHVFFASAMHSQAPLACSAQQSHIIYLSLTQTLAATIEFRIASHPHTCAPSRLRAKCCRRQCQDPGAGEPVR